MAFKMRTKHLLVPVTPAPHCALVPATVINKLYQIPVFKSKKSVVPYLLSRIQQTILPYMEKGRDEQVFQIGKDIGTCTKTGKKDGA